jgi:hypothetical protein
MKTEEHVERYSKIISEIDKIQDALNVIHELTSTFTESHPMSMFKDLSAKINLLPPQKYIIAECLNKSREIVKSAAWLEFVKNNNLHILMNQEQFNEFCHQAKNSPLSFDMENVNATATSLFNNYSANIEAGLINVFESLRMSYKSHDSFCFKKKCILNNFIQLHKHSSTKASINKYDDSAIRVRDLYNGVLYLLYPNRALQQYNIIDDINKHITDNDLEPYEDELMKFTFYQNGNVHMEFSDQRVIKVVNDFLASFYKNSIGHR